MKTSWGNPVHVIRFCRTLLIVLAVAVCTVAAEDLGALRKKAEAGDVISQFNLGVMYDTGEGVTEDDAEAVKWYRKAAEQGDAEAQYALGVMYGNGKGVAEDYAEALKWYRMAAEQGQAKAQFSLGVMYAKGEGVLKNAAAAVKWFRMAAEQGYARAQYFLGWMYAKGDGVPRSSVNAYVWWLVSVKSGDEEARKNLDIVKRELTRSQLARGNALARELFTRIQKGEGGNSGSLTPVAEDNHLDGFWGIRWGTSLADARVKMLTHRGVTIDERLTSADALMCDGGYFNGKPVWKYALLFVDGNFCHGQVICRPSPGRLVFEYREWVADLSTKHGRPRNVWDNSPAKDGNDQIPELIRTGKASYASAWEFPTTSGEINAIIVEINDALLLTITYEDGRLMKQRVKKQKRTFGKDL